MRGEEKKEGKKIRKWEGRSAHSPLLMFLIFLFPSLSLSLLGCTAGKVPDPHDAARAYADAAMRGDAARLYAMMSTPSKEARSRAAVEQMIAEEHEELAEQGKELARADVRVEATARLRYADGEEAALELRGGRYWVTAAGALPGGARTPEEALEQLRRVLARRSYAGLMRVLSPATRASIEHDLRTLVDGLGEPGTLPVQSSGDSAVVKVPGGHQVKLKREAGVWRVEDFD
jgi:D-serine deaminase-like pyridoxal phosphate-dependent protein